MVETMIWVYIVICLLLIFFQIGFLIAMAIRAWRERFLVRKMRRDVIHQMELLSQNRAITERHRAFLSEDLTQPVSLYRYEKALDSILAEVQDGTLALRDPDEITNVTIYIRHRAKNYDNEEQSRGRSKIFLRLRPKKELIRPLGRELAEDYFTRYLRGVAPEIVSLTASYRKKDTIVHSFYVFLLKKYKFPSFVCTPELIANLKDLIETGDSTSCEGVLLAVYTVGDPALVSDFLELVDKQERFVHPKIISDGLLSYGGNPTDLHTRLLADLNHFSPEMQVNLLNYLRFRSGDCCEELLKILADEKTHDEVRFCCIRYFGKYHYEPAYELLAEFADGADRRRVEYAVVALMALRNYPSDRTMQILYRYIHHPNWYVRYNATESMEVLGVEYQDLVDIFDGQDRYAREMLQYQFDQRYALEEEVSPR
ncbi:MAG: hypothetical protein IKJ35_04145 [Clostridia bacterium]|nr:hypothetical protein [Clostridia bacterium]